MHVIGVATDVGYQHYRTRGYCLVQYQAVGFGGLHHLPNSIGIRNMLKTIRMLWMLDGRGIFGRQSDSAPSINPFATQLGTLCVSVRNKTTRFFLGLSFVGQIFDKRQTQPPQNLPNPMAPQDGPRSTGLSHRPAWGLWEGRLPFFSALAFVGPLHPWLGRPGWWMDVLHLDR